MSQAKEKFAVIITLANGSMTVVGPYTTAEGAREDAAAWDGTGGMVASLAPIRWRSEHLSWVNRNSSWTTCRCGHIAQDHNRAMDGPEADRPEGQRSAANHAAVTIWGCDRCDCQRCTSERRVG